jgi:hypothetical protein
MAQRERPIGPCALCLKVRELRSSHIYPRWSVKFLKPKEQHFYSLKGGDQPQLGLPHDAFKEYLLCGECEGLIGRSEGRHARPAA